MRLVYRGPVRAPLKNTSLLLSKSSILYVPKLIISVLFEWEASTECKLDFSFKDLQSDDVAQLEKTFYVLSVRVTDLLSWSEKSVSLRLFQWKVCSTLTYFIHLEALLWNRLNERCLHCSFWLYVSYLPSEAHTTDVVYWALCYSALKRAVFLHYCTMCYVSVLIITSHIACLLQSQCLLLMFSTFDELSKRSPEALSEHKDILCIINYCEFVTFQICEVLWFRSVSHICFHCAVTLHAFKLPKLFSLGCGAPLTLHAKTIMGSKDQL